MKEYMMDIKKGENELRTASDYDSAKAKQHAIDYTNRHGNEDDFWVANSIPPLNGPVTRRCHSFGCARISLRHKVKNIIHI